MQSTDRRAFGSALAATFAIYGQTLTKDVIELWWRVLDGYKLDAVLTALSHHVGDYEGHGHRVPTPADIRRHLEVTLPALARAEAKPFIDLHRAMIEANEERIRRIEADVSLGLVPHHIAQAQIVGLRALVRMATEDPEYQAALRGLIVREDQPEAPARAWLPPAIRRGLAAITGRRA